MQGKSVFSDVHIPPHFVESFLAPLAVMAALEPAETEIKITLLQKALLYDGKEPPGLEGKYNLDEILKEIIEKSQWKEPLEREEGIRRGIPFRFFEDDPGKILKELKYALKNAVIKDKEYKGGCITHISDIMKFYEERFRKYDSIMGDGVKNTILTELLKECFEMWERAMVADVRIAAAGMEDFKRIATRYLAQIYWMERGSDRYEDPITRNMRKIDKEFIEEVESYVTSNPTDFRKMLVNNVTFRLKDYKDKETGKPRIDKLAEKLLEENMAFKNAIEDYILREILPRKNLDLEQVLSETNSELIEKLKKMGYCEHCAVVAIQKASKIKEKNLKLWG